MLSRGDVWLDARKCVKSPQNEPLVMGKGKRKGKRGVERNLGIHHIALPPLNLNLIMIE